MFLLQQLKVEQGCHPHTHPTPTIPSCPSPLYPQLTTLQKNQIWQLDLPLWKGCGLWSFPLGPWLQRARKVPCDTQTGRVALWQ